MKKATVLNLLLSIAISSALAQTGFPPFGSFEEGRFDAVNRQNLNVNFVIPMVAVPGRGVGFQFGLSYDSLIWKRSFNSWVPANFTGQSWGWAGTPIGQPYYNVETVYCGEPPFPVDHFYGYVYVDPAGTRHPFGVDNYSIQTCWTATPTGFATDNSGYYIDATDPYLPIVYSPGGLKITIYGTLTDTNGNYISNSLVGGDTHWIDTVGRTVLKVSSNAYQYQVADGTYQTVTVVKQTKAVKTNFQCSGVAEYTNTAVSLITRIDLPNGRSYTFEYEQTPSFPTYTTGRIKKVFLPTGGYYEYEYPAPNNGMNCSDGTVKNLTKRVSPDGVAISTWTFVRTQIDASNWDTTVTAP
ncbi:MAG TPA: hypothetical protein VGQ71_02605, partial [Terriglobales bacterium]|nr:hypothetical protein [Terriglobales bacterium]